MLTIRRMGGSVQEHQDTKVSAASPAAETAANAVGKDGGDKLHWKEALLSVRSSRNLMRSPVPLQSI